MNVRGKRIPIIANGSYDRHFTPKGIDPVEVEVLEIEKGSLRPASLLGAISTRSLSMISSRLLGRKPSTSEVSSTNKELVEAVERWRTRGLSKESIKYLFIDGVCFSMRIDGSMETVSVLVVIGVTRRDKS